MKALPRTAALQKLFAVLLFLAILFLMFYLSFHVLGPFCQHILAQQLQAVTNRLSRMLLAAHISPAVQALIVQGICAGIGSILSFLPTIAILFFFLYLLKSSNYLDYMSVLLDRPLRNLGLSGQSILPILIGFSCSVPAILAAGEIPQKRHRMITVLMIPFMSCSAKIPVYAAFIAAFFPLYRIWVFLGLYGLGIATALTLARIVRRRNLPAADHHPRHPHIKLRRPSVLEILLPVAGHVLGFVKKAFTVILISSIIIWFLQNFNFSFQMTNSPDDSILATLGKKIAPAFAPAGFGDWRAATAIFTGLSAKETILSTLAVLAQSAPGGSLPNLLCEIFTPLSAISFLIFCLLYVPCVASLAAIRQVFGAWRYAIAVGISQIAFAWLTSTLFYQVCNLIVS